MYGYNCLLPLFSLSFHKSNLSLHLFQLSLGIGQLIRLIMPPVTHLVLELRSSCRASGRKASFIKIDHPDYPCFSNIHLSSSYCTRKVGSNACFSIFKYLRCLHMPSFCSLFPKDCDFVPRNFSPDPRLRWFEDSEDRRQESFSPPTFWAFHRYGVSNLVCYDFDSIVMERICTGRQFGEAIVQYSTFDPATTLS